jgi:FixJ family two-component response regulator
VVSSGYSDSAVMAEHKERGFCASLSKPYTLDELREVVETAIAARRRKAR